MTFSKRRYSRKTKANSSKYLCWGPKYKAPVEEIRWDCLKRLKKEGEKMALAILNQKR